MTLSSSLLVITNKKDKHANYLIEKCYDQGYKDNIVRLNTEDFIYNCDIYFDGYDFQINIKDSGLTVESGDIHSVWYRRPKDFNVSGEYDQDEKKLIKEQGKEFLRGIYFCLHQESLWVNPLPSLHKNRQKLQQLRLAKQVGFNTPETLITNNPSEALEFANCVDKVCIKSLGQPNYLRDGQFQPWMTQTMTVDDLKELIDSVEVCPVFLQEYIDKKFDVRVTVIGDTVFATEIHSQEHPKSKTDFRGVAPHMLDHKSHDLPQDVEEKVQRLVKNQDLRYSAIDLLKSNRSYYFVENNPNGQYLWLELLTNQPMTQSLIELLFCRNV